MYGGVTSFWRANKILSLRLTCKCDTLNLINTISEVARVPFLLVDADAKPIFRSSYYFSINLESQVYSALQKKLADVNLDEGRLHAIAPGMEVVISPATVYNQPMYLVAGYFIDTAKSEQLRWKFGDQVMNELMAKNLVVEWDNRRSLLVIMNNNLAHLLRKLHRNIEEIQSIYQFVRLVYTNQGTQGDFFWKEALKKICGIFPSFWVAVVLFPVMKNSHAFICSENNGGIRRLEPFNCMLSEWIKETGEAVYLPDAAKDLRTEEYLLFEPGLKRLLSLPLKSDNRVWGVLHFALKTDICPRDLELFQGFSQHLGSLEDYDYSKHTGHKECRLDSALGLVIGLLGQERDENVFSLVAEALFKGLKCHSLGIYLKGDNGQFFTAAACGISKAQMKLDRALLEQLYGGGAYMQPPLPMARPQGSGYWEVPIGAPEMYDGFFIIRTNVEFSDEEQQCILRIAKLSEVFLCQQKHRKQANQLIYELMDGMLAMLAGHLPWLEEHTEKTAYYATALGRAAGLPEREVNDLFIAARLHDIGKVKISPALFAKSGKLTLAEKRRLERCGMFGAEILSSIPTLARYAPVLAQLEENVDGSGYPHGLKEEEIHPHSLIIRISSTYSALTAKRAYRDTLQEALAMESMAKDAGKKLSLFYYTVFKKIISINVRINEIGRASCREKV